MKIKDKHNKFIQKLDTPDTIKLILEIAPLIMFTVPAIITLINMYIFKIKYELYADPIASFFIAGIIGYIMFRSLPDIRTREDKIAIIVFWGVDIFIAYVQIIYLLLPDNFIEFIL